MNGASQVRFVLSLLYMCAFQMNPVCVVCVVTSDCSIVGAIITRSSSYSNSEGRSLHWRQHP